MNYASGAALLARRVSRSFGLTRSMAGIYRLFRRGSERAFGRALLGSVRPGDTVWDVGANVGYYTMAIAHHVGLSGRVIAFEPAPATLETLRREVVDLPNVRVVEVALSERSSTQDFFADASGSDPNAGLVPARTDQVRSTVAVRPGDAFLAQYPPSVVKIDVEGLECDVLRGMGATLRSPGLRAVFVEVHFNVLCALGQRDGPRQIADQLAAAGFEVRWPDNSHIAASRPERTKRPDKSHSASH